MHGNGNPRGNGIPMRIPVGMGIGLGCGREWNTVTGMGMAYFSIRKKIPNVSQRRRLVIRVTDEQEN